MRILPPLLLLLVACGEEASDLHPHQDIAERTAWAEAVVPDRVPIATLPAEVVPGPGAAWNLAPPTSGRLVSWEVVPGQRVSAGDPLATLTSPRLAELEAQATALRATITRRETALGAARAAERSGIGSTTTRVDAEAALAEARAEAGAIARRLSATRDTTSRSGGTWVWQAPAAGTVQALRCEPGPVSADHACISLVDTAGGQVQVRLPERYLSEVGSAVSGTFEAVDGTTATLSLLTASPGLDPHTRTRALRFAADPPVLLGASGRATLVVPASEGIVAVPARALTRIEGSAAVMRKQGDTAEPVNIELVGRDAERIYLRGLDAGDPVATEGVFLLKSLSLLDEDAGGHSH